MSKMQRIKENKNRMSILQKINKVFSKWSLRKETLSPLPTKSKQKPKTSSINNKDTKLEIKDGRCNTRRSYHTTKSILWNADKKSKSMERILRTATRNTKAEGISERERKLNQRTSSIKRLYQNQDFKLFWKKMCSDENFWLNEIQKPAGIKDGVTLDYYYGFCNGNLKAIAELRDFVMGYQFKIDKDAIKKEEENRSRKNMA